MNEYFLLGHMKKYGDTRVTLAEILGIHPHTLYMKMQGEKQEFTQSEIRAISARYKLSADEISKIFF